MAQVQVSESEGGDHHAGPTLVFFVVFGMLVGAICRAISKQTKFPYTPLLLISGLGLGYFRHILPVVGHGADLMSNMNPHMILFVFIPVLIFESGFNCDWYVFKKEIVNILLLAAPGVLWGALLIAMCFKLILGYDELSWNQALTLGCVLSATDPVAVVALLKELGASVRFNTLIEGESLLNDGTAMVFFAMFMEMVKGQTASAGGVLISFIRIGLGGPLLGVCVGLVAAHYLKKVVRDDIMTANITFLSCYICFWLAEYTFLKVSGILSIVVLGLFLSAMARTRIHPQSQHSLHSIWSYIQYICETTIFLLTGIIIAVELIERSTITSSDWIKMFIFFVLMNLCRFVMCLTFLPLLRSFGYGVTMKEFVVLVYGGLRGALGLCLGLLVAVDGQLNNRFRQITIFYMSGMATMTLLINGTTCGRLVNYVEMIEKPAIKEKLYRRCLKDIIKLTDKTIDDLKTNRFLSMVDWQKVKFYLGDTKMTKKVDELTKQIDRKSHIRSSGLSEPISDKEVQTELRYKTIKLIQGCVWERYESGQCEETAAKFISEICNVNLDSPSTPLQYWQHLAPSFTSYGNLTFWIKAQSWPLVGSRARNYIVVQLYSIYDITTNLIIVIEEAKEIMEQFVSEEEYQVIRRELEGEVGKAENYLINLQTQFPQMIGIIQMKNAVCTILKQRKEEYHEYNTNGLIDDGQLKDALVELDKQLYALDELELGVPEFKKESLQYPLFATLNNIELDYVMQNSKIQRFDKDIKLYEAGQPINELYLIISGGVIDTVGSEAVSRGMGGILSPANVLSRSKQSYSTATISASDTYVRTIPMDLVFKLMVNPEFRFKIFTTSIFYFSRLYRDRADFLASMEQNKLSQYVRRSSLEAVVPGEVILLEQGGYIYEGQMHLEGYGAEYTYPSYTYLPAGYSYQNISNRRVSILKFREPRPDQDHHRKKHEKRYSMLEGDDKHRKSQIATRLLNAHGDRAALTSFTGKRDREQQMAEMLAVGDSKNRKSRNVSTHRKSGLTGPPEPPTALPHATSIPEEQPSTSIQSINGPQITVQQPAVQEEPEHQMTAQQYYYWYYQQQQMNQQNLQPSNP